MSPDLTEEAILNPDALHCHSHPNNPDLRRFRIEYGFECACPEGVIYVPATISGEDLIALEEMLEKLFKKAGAVESDWTEGPLPGAIGDAGDGTEA